MGIEEQKEILRAQGFTDKQMKFWIETDSVNQPKLKTIIEQMRYSNHDTVEVSDLHRLCSRSECMADFIDQIAAKNGTVVEWREGEIRSSQTGKFAKALVANSLFLSGKMSKAARSQIGKLGAAASPVSNYKTGVMPLHEIEAIFNDRKLSLDQAYDKYYADPRYKVRVSKPTILRWAREERFQYHKRPAGGISRKSKRKPKR